jgi:hypothetical protein
MSMNSRLVSCGVCGAVTVAGRCKVSDGSHCMDHDGRTDAAGACYNGKGNTVVRSRIEFGALFPADLEQEHWGFVCTCLISEAQSRCERDHKSQQDKSKRPLSPSATAVIMHGYSLD